MTMLWATDRSMYLHMRCCCCAGWIVLLAAHAFAEEERACDLPPFDQVVLDEANENAVLKIEPLEQRTVQIPADRVGDLTIRLLADPTRAFDVSWQHIRQVLLFEDFLLAEAMRLTAAGKFDEAFDYYARLLRDYPQQPGLNESVNDYLRRNALALVNSQQYDRALAVLTTLYERAPDTPGIRQSVDTVCSKMLEQQIRERSYAAARGVLEVWRREFRGLDSPAIAVWEQRFAAAAERQLSEAREQIASGDFIEARKSIGRARDIWPDAREANELRQELQQANPSVIVGVFETSPTRPVRRIDDWAAIRTSRLRQPALNELVGFGSEGGEYRSRYGVWESDASGMRLSLTLRSASGASDDAAPSAAAIARSLLRMADQAAPEFEADFADVLAAVSVEGPNKVHLDWKHPHVRPEAWLQRMTVAPTSLETSDQTPPDESAPWNLADDGPEIKVFEVSPVDADRRPWLRTIVEQTMPDDKKAVDALLHGEIDVLDRVPPWQWSRLRSAPGVRLDSYALPTVHALVLNPGSPLLKMREFRRAVCYAIPRERILSQVLLGGTELPGFTVLSGPFPAGMSLSDPLRYAYNNQVDPRPFEPRLSAVLASVAWTKILDPSGKGEVEPQPIPTLILAHPADPVARLASESIQIQLTKAGIPVELVEFTADELLAGKVKYDLRYAELAAWEPVVDARAILGRTGLAGELCSGYLDTTLHALADATNWKDVRSTLGEIHDIAHHDLPLIPLWQSVNYFAYRNEVQGIGDAPVTLYQNIDEWRTGIDATVAEIRN
jgi:ABC-type transport system substrate-binding protein